MAGVGGCGQGVQQLRQGGYGSTPDTQPHSCSPSFRNKSGEDRQARTEHSRVVRVACSSPDDTVSDQEPETPGWALEGWQVELSAGTSISGHCCQRLVISARLARQPPGPHGHWHREASHTPASAHNPSGLWRPCLQSSTPAPSASAQLRVPAGPCQDCPAQLVLTRLSAADTATRSDGPRAAAAAATNSRPLPHPWTGGPWDRSPRLGCPPLTSGDNSSSA